MDYCFVGRVGEEVQPILVVKERDTGMLLSFLVRGKGLVDELVVRRVLAFLQQIGLDNAKVIVRSDQEAPIKAVVQAVIKARGDAVTIPEHSPVGSSGSNGVIERGVKEVEGQIRTLKSALDARIGRDLSGSAHILPWLIEFSAVLLCRYLVGHDGKTPYERCKGKQSRMLGMEFAEKVLFRRTPAPGQIGKMDSLWNEGMFVGYRGISGEYLIANDDGVFKTRIVRRVPQESRWDTQGVMNLKYTP